MQAVAGINLARLRKRAVWVGFVASLVWTAWTWSGGFSEAVDLALRFGAFGVLLVLFDVFLLVGFALQFFGAGHAIGFRLSPLSWWRSIRRLFSARKEALDEVVNAKWVRAGYYLSNFCAISFAVVAPVVVLAGFPRSTWLGLLGLLAADTSGTILRIVTQKKIMDARLGKLSIHTAKAEDLDGCMEAQRVSWGEDMAAGRAKLEKRFEIFPEGILVAERHGRVVAAVTTIRIPDYDEEKRPSWNDITADGWCTTHDPKGKVMFGVDMSATGDAPPGVHDDLLVQCVYQVIREGLESGVLGGRMPGYHNFSEKLPAEEYLWLRRKDGKFFDAQIRMYDSFPGLKVVGLLPDYFEDEESLNNGVLLVWSNPFYRLPGKRFWAWAAMKAIQADSAVTRWRKFRRNRGRPR